eukprot:TRINITY_DN298_c3_g1_i1.p1 TRINITY_DN298_c3_g1~~TRINITY_DN298_c3_g1_i1.p1  ORF type:complete len:125 (+),score=4.02 TRINITY_DN298_c3_g1_i1:749-1123(+)
MLSFDIAYPKINLVAWSTQLDLSICKQKRSMFSYKKITYAVQLMGSTYMHVTNGKRARWKGLPIDKGEQKNGPTRLALDLTGLNFNGVIIIDFLRFNPIVSEGSMSIKLNLMPNQGIRRVSNGL